MRGFTVEDANLEFGTKVDFCNQFLSLKLFENNQSSSFAAAEDGDFLAPYINNH